MSDEAGLDAGADEPRLDAEANGERTDAVGAPLPTPRGRRNLLLTFATVVALASVSLVAIVVTGGDDESTHRWSAQARNTFRDGCLETSGGNEPHCACALKEAQDLYSEEEMRDIDQRAIIDSAAVPDEFRRAVAKCAAAAARPGADSTSP